MNYAKIHQTRIFKFEPNTTIPMPHDHARIIFMKTWPYYHTHVSHHVKNVLENIFAIYGSMCMAILDKAKSFVRFNLILRQLVNPKPQIPKFYIYFPTSLFLLQEFIKLEG